MRSVFLTLFSILAAVQLISGLTLEAHASVVTGEFIYQKQGLSKTAFSYRVEQDTFQGVPAWRVSWQGQGMNADHLIRRSDLRPLYTSRENHRNGQRIEIRYSTLIDTPTRYRRFEGGKTVELNIWHTNLYDLGTLPQLLASRLSAGDQQNIKFSAINYNDGKVYELKARRGELRSVVAGEGSIDCVEYTVSLDSWMSAIISPVRLLISGQQSLESNLVAYKGPGLDGVESFWSLLLVASSSRLAMAERAPAN